MMIVEEIAPSPVAELGGSFSRAADVRKQDRGEHAVGLGSVADPGEELLDLFQGDVDGITNPRKMIDAWQLHESGLRDPFGHVACAVYRERAIPGRMKDQ